MTEVAEANVEINVEANVEANNENNITMSVPTVVRLKCIKVGSKLRVRILTPGYFTNANCQFPKDLRVEGRLYDVPVSAVTLVTRNKNFYSITKKSAIKIVLDIDCLTDSFADAKINIKVYEDNASDDCAICMTNEKCMIIVPCGHYYTCASCTALIKKCPICRCGFTKAINKSQML
jgi:hypothetical protein